MFQKFISSGAKVEDQQWCQNVINAPLLHGPRDKLVLGLINIPDLHLLLGKTIIYSSYLFIHS